MRDAENRVQSSGQQFAGLDKERQMLVEVKRFLEQSEGQMIRRWATQKAAGYVVAAVLTVAVLAAGAYVAGQKFTQPVYRATLSLQVDGPAGPQGLPTEGPAPQAFRTATLYTPAVLNETLTQLDRQGTRLFENPADLKADLDQHLSVEGAKGELTLAYTAPGTDRGARVLEALRHATVGYQMAEDRKAGRVDSLRVSRAVARLEQPVSNPALAMSGQIFGIGLGAAVLVYLALRFLLLRSRRTFDTENDPQLQILDKPETWSPVPASEAS